MTMYNNSEHYFSPDNTSDLLPPYLTTGYEMQESFYIKYVLPVIIVIGTLGNTLTIAVCRRKKLRAFSVGFYLSAYSVVNLLFLFIVYGASWISNVTTFPELENLSDWGCRIWKFVYRMVTFSGIWIMVATLLDRYISVCHPCRATSMCTVFMAKLAVVLIFIGLTVLNVHAMWTYELRRIDGCHPLDQTLLFKIWNWLSAICSTYIPIVVLIALSILLISGMCTATSHVAREDGIPADLTKTVLALSVIYVALTTPATLVNIVHHNLSPTMIANDEFMHHLTMVMLISNFLISGNPVVVVFVCLMFSRQFRQEVSEITSMFCFRRNKQVSNELTISSGCKDIHIDNDDCSHETLL